MYINFWYPMAVGEELTDQPMKVRALNLDFVVFRDESGNARCLSNTCVHRGGSLSGGKIVGDCVQCPYHGWQFDGQGHCHRIPSLGPDAKIPARSRVDAYPVEEQYGIIFAFLGDLSEEERPPLLKPAEWGQDGWRATMQNYQVKCNYERSVENGLDPAHNEFVHSTHGFGGENAEYHMNDMRMDHSEPWGQGFWHTFHSPKLPEGEMRKLRDYEGELEAGTGHLGPNQLWTFIHVTPENSFHQYAWERPIDENTIHVYFVTMRNCALDPGQDEMIKGRNWFVAKEDIAVIEKLRPVITPESTAREYMLPADKVIVMYRDKLREWDARGWRIDTDEVLRNIKKVAYAVPGPARRAAKGWVLDEVPRLNGQATGY
jgi:phenylpropionate dioxygenase-like ring-hydroxylating dioxygenase large terminal subunit